MIPKIIHYCWFGGNPLPELAKKCIASWEKYFPDYEIKEWNETNYDIHKIPYISEAYNAKKYAFVSDYARFDALYQYGGIYFDTDVEVIKSFDDILKNGGFMGLESTGSLAAGLGIGCNAGLGIGCNAGLGIGCNAGLGIVYQILEFYASLCFLNSDGSYNTKTVVEYVTAILNEYGLKNKNIIQKFDGFTIYPAEYFCPLSYRTGKLIITMNTHSIHHYEGSWTSSYQKEYDQFRKTIFNTYGEKIGRIIIFPYFLLWQIKDYGLKKVFLKTIHKIKYYIIKVA